jgi:hypothetical protein
MAIDLEQIRNRLERIRLTFVAQMEVWLKLLPEDARDQPFVGLAGDEALTPREMVSEVSKGTEWGDRFLDNAIALMAAGDLQRHVVPDAEPPSSPAEIAPKRTRAASKGT